MRVRLLSWICAVVLLLAFYTSHLSAQEEVIKKRKDFMNANYDALKAIKKGVAGKDYATVELKAKEIMGNMDMLLDHFPKGSTSEKSRAKEEIWEKWDEFSKIPGRVRKAAAGLARAAGAGDEAEVQVKFKELGSESPFRSGACFECHNNYLKPRKKAGG